MSKRQIEDADDEPQPLKAGSRPSVDQNGEELDFEDPYDDEWEEEDEIFEAGVDGRPDAEREAEEAKEGALYIYLFSLACLLQGKLQMLIREMIVISCYGP